MSAARHVLINGLSIGGGGGVTVGKELWRHLALARPDYQFTLALVDGHPLHREITTEGMPANTEIHCAPAAALNRLRRSRYERGSLVDWARRAQVDAVLQLNGMVVPGMPAPTLSHMQDPHPYRPIAWNGWTDRVVSALRRRQHAQAMRTAACVGWTSAYLRDLICGELGFRPHRGEVFHNGVPPEWADRVRGGMEPLDGRPCEIMTLSNVAPYKRQDLVVRTLPLLIRRRGLEKLVYHLVGFCADSERLRHETLARELGVSDHVVIHSRVSDGEMARRLRSARCCVQMSVCESFGIPAIEAMSFGTPVVASDCCAMPETCGEAAILSPVDDVAALAENIARVLTEAELARALRERGALRVPLFRWDQTAARMADVLDEIASRSVAAGRVVAAE
jgi:glycosyltransferase involved in cell wall biosynthesis